ncbi:unnamed protein product [Gemmata massiliana]|uniref:Uncharacterized protein n=1 Tax=Gemmata massiliana TaxID=1210884 RepID=A0A6P2DC09_9BACT|nr:hypothetical protein [Gemmata massiliana]VTR97885.1 unnamed protein product [Gemmata massiliana]
MSTLSISPAAPRECSDPADLGTITIQYPGANVTCQLPLTVYGIYTAAFFPVITCVATKSTNEGAATHKGDVSIDTVSKSWSASFNILPADKYDFAAQIFHPPCSTPDNTNSVDDVTVQASQGS